jgi:biotin operon repressor
MGKNTSPASDVKSIFIKYKGRYCTTPARSYLDGRLTGMDRRMLAAIGHHIDKYGSCFFNQTTLAEKMNVARQSVNRAVARLEELGYITKRDINDGRLPKRPTSICRYELIFDEKDMEEGNDDLKQDGDSDETPVFQLDETNASLLNTPLRTYPLEHTPTCATRAAPEIALASTDAGHCYEDSLFPEGPFVRVRSMTPAERAEPLKVIKRSSVSAAERERLTHPRDYVDDYENDAMWGEAIREDSFPAPHPVSDAIDYPARQPDLHFMAYQASDTESRISENSATAPVEPLIEFKAESLEFGIDVGKPYKKGLEVELYTGAVDNPERPNETFLMAFPESRVEKSRIGETTTIASNTKPVLGSGAAEKKETNNNPLTAQRAPSQMEICKEERVENSEFQLTSTHDTVVQTKPRKRKTTPALCAETKYPFATFWAAYPRKHGKAPAEKTWAKLTEAQRAAAIAGIAAYMRDKEGCDKTFIKHGSTYLNQKVWEEYEPEPIASDNTVVQTQQALPSTSSPAPISKHAARNARGAEKYPGDPYFGFGAQKLESLLNYRAHGNWVGGVINSQYDWWEGEPFEPELVALAERVESGEILFDDAMDSVRPVAKPLPQRPQLRVVR